MSRPSYGGERQTSTTAHGPYGGSYGGESREGAAGGEHGRAEAQSHSGYAMGPGGGAAVGESRSGSATGRYGATASGESRGGVYRGPGGTTVAGGEKSGTVTGPGGTTASGSKSGAVVMGPAGNVHATGTTSGEVNGAGGTTVAGASRKTAVAGPDGAAYDTTRAGVATGQGGTVAGGSRSVTATSAYGTTAATSRTGAATGPYGAAAAGTQTAVAAGTRYAAPSTVQAQGVAVRNNYMQVGAFSPGWSAAHPAVWTAGRYTTGSAYAVGNWGNTSSFVGVAAGQPGFQYNYGTNVTCQGGNVYYGAQVAATEPQYAQQATAIAQAGQTASPPAGDDWQPLGVFAMTKADESQSNDTFQLAVNRQGIVRGNYYNAVADVTQPLAGSVDAKTQRVAWTVGGKADVVYETGLYNLSLDDTSMLAHFGPNRTEQYGLYRIPPPTGRGPGH
jgi:hypothetical protein